MAGEQPGPAPGRARRSIRLRAQGSVHPSLDALPTLLARVYAARGVRDAASVDYTLSRLLPPDAMLGLEGAADRLATAVENDESILVVGDYDADGATSTATMLLCLRVMGCARAEFLVPNRFEFGYGLSPGIVELAAARRPSLIVTVDNGISSVEGVEAAARHGVEVLITDHHLAGDRLPAATAIVNPNQPGCCFPSKHLSGVGVVFYLMSALRARLRERGWFVRRGLDEPGLAAFLDLVALGTVADLVPLDENNRILVEQGLRRIRAGRCRPGIRALLEIAGRRPERSVASDLGFAVAPRLNAAGRLDDMSLGIRCLLEDDMERARGFALRLDALNRERRDIEAEMQEEAARAAQQMLLADADMPWGICLYREDWHQGVVGLVASRLKERHHRPVVAFAPGAEGELKGSARSIPQFHLRDALVNIACRRPGLIERFGGHAMAAGLSLREESFAEFAREFDDEVRRSIGPADLEGVVESDGELVAPEFSLETAEALRMAGPWGQQFPEPTFDGDFFVRHQRVVGGRHLRLKVSPVASPDLMLAAIAFNVDAARWPDPTPSAVRLAYRLDVNEFRGERSVQLQVEHVEACGREPAEVA